jgi:hypothetical protein
MGRKTKKEEEKKGKISISISSENYMVMITKNINKSQLINWLLEEHFNTINHGN